MVLLRKALALLVDESRSIQDRIYRIRPYYQGAQDAMLPYLGIPTLTAILLVAYPEKYGVWNKTSIEGMQLMDLWDDRWLKGSTGLTYLRINNLYHQLRDALNIDLWTLDALWWVLKK